MPGGARPGAGRKKGVPNTRTQERVAKAEASGLMPHDFLLAVSRGEVFDGYRPTFTERMKAATDAANYFAAKLASIEVTGRDGGPIEAVAIITDDPLEAARQYQRLMSGE